MHRLALFTISATATLTALLPAQNILQHQDGTVEFTSRGPAPASTVMPHIVDQYYPEDQTCNRSGIQQIVITVQDQNALTVESAKVDVIEGSPTAPGLFVTGWTVTTPSGFSGAMAWTTTFTFPCAAFTGCCGDFFVRVYLPVAPSWPADGLSVHASMRAGAIPGEQMRATGVGYAATLGGADMSYETSPIFPYPQVATAGNKSWAIAVGLCDDVLQPFADNAARFTGLGGTGLNYNYGYAGIWPDATAVDRLGLRCRTSAAPGSLCALIIGPEMPTPMPTQYGCLCVQPLIVMLGLTAFEDAAMSTSTAWFGTFGLPLANIGDVYFQAVTVHSNSVARLSTACRANIQL